MGLSVVLVVVPLCSHPIREYAVKLAAAYELPIYYLRTASISAVRSALEKIDADRDSVRP